jgi:hypothetical protein
VEENRLKLFENRVLRRIVRPEMEEVAEEWRRLHNKKLHNLYKSRDSSVGIALCYGLDNRGSRFRFPAGAGNFSLHRVQNGSGAHPASYPTGTRGLSLGVKRPGREADHSPPPSAEVKKE